MEPWTCFARPAGTGRTCWHENAEGMLGVGPSGSRMLCCEECGATKIAGDDRVKRGDYDRQKPRRLF